ncbi:MAG: hypothetical protein ACJ75A_08480 [Actinomycetes bacterium]|jgi:hypothetical protein
MSRLTRVLVLGAMLGAMSLSVTAIAQAQTTSGDAVQRFRQGERAFQEAATSGDAVQRFRQGERTSLTQPTVPVPAAAPPTGQSNWLVPALGVLVAVLALGGGLVAMAGRTRGKIRPRQAI